MGLPEVKLGLLPGFGGTQNLHKLVGLQNAMDMMLTGKDVRPAKAKKMGLVDLVVAPQSVEAVAIQSAIDLASGKLKPKRKPKSWMNRLLEDTSIGQKLIWNQVEKIVQMSRTRDFRDSILESDVIIYDLMSNDFTEVDYVIKTLKTSKLTKEKTLIILSSVMTWVNTLPKLKVEGEEEDADGGDGGEEQEESDEFSDQEEW